VARYSVTNTRPGINTANSAMWQLRAASTQRVFLLELGIFVATAPANAPQIRFNRPTAVGTITATSPRSRRTPATPPP
jgi:catalase